MTRSESSIANHSDTPTLRHTDTRIFRDILDGIRAEPARVGLALLSIAVGIVSLVLLLAVLGGLEERSKQLVRELGANVIAVAQEGNAEGAGKPNLEEKHAELLARNLPGCVVSVQRRYELETPGEELKIGIIATDESLADMRGWRMRQGRFIDRQDVQRSERNAAVSGALAELKRWKVGDVISLEDTPFRIVGIMEPGSGTAEDGFGSKRFDIGENVLFVPKNAPFPRRGESVETSRRADTIFIRVPADMDFYKVLATAQKVLGAPAVGLDGVSWVTPESLIQGIRRLQKSVKIAGGGITFLCLVLGGTTLMSLMLANVRDRVVEIGLRRALGASAMDVAKLFVLEACVVTCIAAIMGMLTAGSLLIMVQKRSLVTISIGGAGFMMPFVVSLILGILFSYWPARMAANISPAEALRNE